MLRGLDWILARRPEFKQRILTGSRGMLDVIALRSRAVDTAWADAHRDGVRNLVILGAGLDARAYRLPELEDVSVFEVDHPWTQDFKRERARGLCSSAASPAYVPVDFARDDLGQALRGAGLRQGDRIFWIWEGVTPYLTHQATAATLAAIASLSPTASRLVITYVEPASGARTESAVMRTRSLMLRWAGEPHVGMLGRGHMARLLAQAGWRVRTDEGLDDLSVRFSDGPANAAQNVRERVVLADRD